ncbi:hypothetical protein L0Y65_04600 [Candidatus Micrarchaeota archaeon]|nr:hypothetical protein [Candidatus Micrarchaeota archaeon]
MEFYFKALLWLVMGIVIGFAVFFVFLQPEPQSGSLPEIPENPGPENDTMPPILESGLVNLTMVEAPGCDICNAEGQMLEQAKAVLLKSEFLQVDKAVRLPADSPEAQALISNYNLTTLPAVIIEGDVARDAEFVSAWTESIGTLEGASALVTRFDYPPYYDITNRTVVGLAMAIGIRASGCMECGDPALFISSLESPPVSMAFINKSVYDENDSRAQALIAQYNITKLPALLIAEDGASAYPVFEQIRQMGTIEDGWFILRDMVPPYVDLADNRSVRGLVNATYLVNSSCSDCFNISTLSGYLAQTNGVVIVSEKTYEADSIEGMALLEKYNITKIPALIFSDEVKYYYKFPEVWLNESNTIEPDGSFVFRAHDLLGGLGYQNISG